MGILDDAIHEHLDLKRRLGARDAEIKQLEDEAFGPPARPGEPEFGETTGGDAEASVESEAFVAESSGALRALSEPVAADGVELRVPPELAVPDADDQSPAEQAPLTHPELEDTDTQLPFEAPEVGAAGSAAPEVPPEAAGSGGAVSEVPPEAAAPAPQAPSAEPDIEAEDFDVGDLSLALDDDEAPTPRDDDGFDQFSAEETATEDGPVDESTTEPQSPAPVEETTLEEEPAPSVGEVAAEDRPPAPIEPPATEEDLLPTVEETAAEDRPPAPVGWPGVAEEPPSSVEPPDREADGPDQLSVERAAPADAAPPASEPEPEDPGETADGADDLLEETPEFLRDAPDSDRLWFEQGEPEGFDFEDEED